MSIRILIASENSEQILFLHDVLEDIESGRHWRGWVRIDALHAPTVDDAIATLADESVDVVLLDAALCGVRAVAAFRRLQESAPQIPVILLAEQKDREMANRLIREGAQDVLAAQGLDAAPLAHALANAMERQRILNGARAGSQHDSLTGLLNRSAFLAWGERDLRLAEKLGCDWMVMVAEPGDPDELVRGARGDRDLFLIEAADRLRRLTGPTDLLARIGDVRFGIGVFGTKGTAQETVEAAFSRIHFMAREHGLTIGAAVADHARAASLETLIAQAEIELTSKAMAMRI